MPFVVSRQRKFATLGAAMLGMWVWGVQGNDTGGIIAWAPGVEETALATASDHCARYGKYAVITSVHPWPGDYIGFTCRRSGRFGPVSR